MRSHPVLGNSGFPMFFGRLLDEGIATGAVLVKEEDDEEEEEGICAGWAAATSAAWTLGSRKQKKGGLARWMKPCSWPVLSVPWGAESASRLCRATLVLRGSGCITLQLLMCCNREKHMVTGWDATLAASAQAPSSKPRASRRMKAWQCCTGCFTKQLLNSTVLSTETGKIGLFSSPNCKTHYWSLRAQNLRSANQDVSTAPGSKVKIKGHSDLILPEIFLTRAQTVNI